MTTKRHWALVVLLAVAPLMLGPLGACTDEVSIQLSLGDCDAAQLEWDQVFSIRAQLLRGSDGLTVQSSCVKTNGALTSLVDLERLLGASVVFNDLPAEGIWTVRVRGFFTDNCVNKTALVCGRLSGVDLGASSTLIVPVDCAPRVAIDPPKAFKECVDEL